MIATARSNKRRPQQQGMKLYPILLVIIFFWIGWSSIFAHIHLSSLDSNSGFEVTSKNATITTVSRLPPPSSSDQESSSSTVDEAKLAFRRLQSSWTSKRNSPECRVFYNYSDIQRCVAPYDRRNFTEESRSGCETIETWDDVQKCMNGDRNNQKEKPPNLVINLIGERNSGTKWMVDEMKQCFPNHKIERDYGGRSKHFFQISEYRYNAQRKRIVIAAFRDPVEWVAAMIEKPYHMTVHQKGFDKNNQPIPLPWHEFVELTWTMPNRSRRDLEYLKKTKKDPERIRCRNGMQYNQVIPCYFDPGTIPEAVVREQNPVYELKRGTTTDEPYKNILELRSDKIVNMLLEMGTIPDFSGYLAVRMEDLLRNGTGSFLLDVARMIGLDGLPPGCSPQDPQPERIGRRHIPDGLRTWIENHLIMRTERLLGYR